MADRQPTISDGIVTLNAFSLRMKIDNVASRAAAEGASFQLEGILRSAGVYAKGRRDMALYSRLRGGVG